MTGLRLLGADDMPAATGSLTADERAFAQRMRRDIEGQGLTVNTWTVDAYMVGLTLGLDLHDGLGLESDIRSPELRLIRGGVR